MLGPLCGCCANAGRHPRAGRWARWGPRLGSGRAPSACSPQQENLEVPCSSLAASRDAGSGGAACGLWGSAEPRPSWADAGGLIVCRKWVQGPHWGDRTPACGGLGSSEVLDAPSLPPHPAGPWQKGLSVLMHSLQPVLCRGDIQALGGVAAGLGSVQPPAGP